MSKRTTPYNDTELIAVIHGQTGREREMACSELYSRYGQRVYVYCRRILDDSRTAEDVLQETFIRVIKSVQNGEQIGNVHGYIFQVARNLCLNVKRQRRTELIQVDEFEYPHSDNQFENQDLKEVLGLSLDVLPEDQREAVVLQLYNGYSYQEIGDLMNVPVTTVRNWVVRAKVSLRKTLSPYFTDK